MAINVDYNAKITSLRDVNAELITDITGRTLADTGIDNKIVKTRLDGVEGLANDNRIRVAYLEQLSIKQQSEIDFIKNSPTNFCK